MDGKGLVEHPGTHKVSFTGSVPTGIAVGRSAMGAGLTRATLELGGKNAAGFLRDMDVDKAVDGIIEAGFLHSGQICAAAERFFVQRSQIDAVLEKLKALISHLTIGSPLDEHTDFGPVTHQQHQHKLLGYFNQARAENNTIIHGGHPIATFLPYDDEDELLAMMNHGPYGLSASLWTNDLGKALRMIPAIKAGTLWVNMHTLLDPAVPFGGSRSSGLGREFGSAFIEDYTELKSVMIRY